MEILKCVLRIVENFIKEEIFQDILSSMQKKKKIKKKKETVEYDFAL